MFKIFPVSFDTSKGRLHVIDRLSYSLKPGETLGIVGESGSGKSVSSLAVMSLLPSNAKITAEKMQFLEHDLLTISESKKQSLRGGDMAMIFQDPMTSLNPCFTVGFQLSEAIKAHQRDLSKKDRRDKSIELLKSVGIPSPRNSYESLPSSFVWRDEPAGHDSDGSSLQTQTAHC